MIENKRNIHNNCEYYDEGVCLAYFNVYGNAWNIDQYNYCLSDMDEFIKRKIVMQNDLGDLDKSIKRGRW